MGIKDLSKYIRENTSCYEEISLEEYRGKKFAVDISVFLYKTVRSRGEQDWVGGMVSMLMSLKKFAIKIVCVFDDPNVPPEKLKERAERRSSSEKVRQKVETIKKLIVETMKHINDGTEMPRQLRADIRDTCMKQRDSEKFEDLDYRNHKKALKALKDTEEKFAKQCILITKEHSEIIKEITAHLGMAVMQADGEAETLCAYMCIKGMVDAVLTEDTDVLAYGTPVFLSKFDGKEDTVMRLRIEDILQQLDFEFEQFRDFCIMCSCDYNDRIKFPPKKPTAKPTGVGPAKAYKLLQEHSSIDNIDYMTDLDTSPLIYQRCRVLFTLPEIYHGLVLPYNKPLDVPKVEEFLTKHNCKYLLPKIKELWAPTKIVFVDDDDVDESPVNSPPISSPETHQRLCKREFNPPISSPETHKRLCKREFNPPLTLPSATQSVAHKRLCKQEFNLPPEDDVGFQSSKICVDKITIHTDGSCIGNGNIGAGGWAAILQWSDDEEDKEKVLRGSQSQTTNNRMEMTAALNGIICAKKEFISTSIEVITDSQYVKDGITKWITGWKAKNWKTSTGGDVKNQDLWKKLDSWSKGVQWSWVKGHDGDPNNERADALAKIEANRALKNKVF